MQNNLLALTMYSALAVVLNAPPVLGQATIAADMSAEEEYFETNFNFGDNCERLEEVSDQTLMRVLRSKYHMRWNEFCRISDQQDCDLFSYLFDGLGFLAPSLTVSGMCRFVPLQGMQEWIPDFYRNFGRRSPGEDLNFDGVETSKNG